jgi:hypothetical protein
MGLSIRRIGLAVFLASSLFAWSCEKHHVGELPPENPAAGAEHASPATIASPTPAEFFPTSTPR